MKNHLKSSVCLCLAVMLLVLPARPVSAQDTAESLKAVAVVSVAPGQEMLEDIGFLTQSAGQPLFGQLAAGFAQPYLQAMDQTKPAGAYVALDEQMQPTGVAFAPVTDLDALLAVMKEQVGEPEDKGNGILEIATDQPQPMFVKQQGSWAFFSQNMEKLSGALPQDPSTILGDLPQKYSVAVRIYASNVPDVFKQMAKDQIQQGFDASAATNDEAVQKLGRNSMKSVYEFVDGTEQITVGWAIDPAKQSTHIDTSITAVPGTGLARRMAMLSETKSKFAGFNIPGAAVSMNVTARSSKEDIDQSLIVLDTFRQKALEAIDKDKSLANDADKQVAKDVLGSLLDVVQKTAESGKTDAGASLVLKPGELGFAMGIYVLDGPTLDSAFKKLVAAAKNEPQFPDVAFDSAKHGEVTFHTVTAPVADPEAAKLLGDTMDLYVGIGPEALYTAFGTDGLTLVKQAIDDSAANAEETVSPFNLTIALTPIAKFVESMDNDPMAGMVVAALEKSTGKDHVVIDGTSIPNGVNYQVKIEAGVLQLIGQMGAMAGAGGPGGPGGAPPAGLDSEPF